MAHAYLDVRRCQAYGSGGGRRRSNAWAVGSYFPPGPFIDRALTLHWNGRVWRRVPVPDTGRGRGSALTGVSGISPGDVWAVGEYQFGREGVRDLIEHWNGRAWRRLQGPSRRGVAAGGLNSVTAAARDRVWATGGQTYNAAVPGAALIRWNGRHWRKVRLPRPAHAVGLGFLQVAAGPADNAWAVGSYSTLHRGNLLTQPLAMHWTGKSWKQAPLPGPKGADLSGVAIASPANVWAAGTHSFARGQLFLQGAVIEHWNGRSWQIFRSAHPGSPEGDSELTFMAGTSASDMWAVGQHGFKATHALVLHCCRWRALPP